MEKKKIARKIITNKELKAKVPIFLTEAWEKRKAGIALKVANKIKKIKERKAARTS
jgi:hypothetical protein